MRKPPRKRTALIEDRILKAIRQQIVDGRFSAGEKLPTRVEIEQRYRASTCTVQRAMHRLAHDGFIVTNRKDGTRVADRPPHQYRFGFVTYANPRDERGWNLFNFQRYLFEEAQALHRAGRVWFSTYTQVDGRPDNEDYHRLLSDVDNQRLAGLIFDAPTFLDSPALVSLLDERRVPVITMAGEGEKRHPNLSTVAFDGHQTMDSALEHFQQAGCRRVALLASGVVPGRLDYFCATARKRGLETRSAWQQVVTAQYAPTAANCMELLMAGREVPDALLIYDDILVEPATAGLRAAGVRGAASLTVVATANFPRLPLAHVPVRWLGFGIHEVLQICLKTLQERTADLAPVQQLRLAPRWDQELSQPVGKSAAPRLENLIS